MNKTIKDAENAIAKVWEAGYREGLKVGREEKNSQQEREDEYIPAKLYLARDKDGSLWLYEKSPIKSGEIFIESSGNSAEFSIDGSTFVRDITWENSPIEYQRVIKNTEE